MFAVLGVRVYTIYHMVSSRQNLPKIEQKKDASLIELKCHRKELFIAPGLDANFHTNA